MEVFLCILLIVIVLLSYRPVHAQSTGKQADPETGEVISGFEVVEFDDIPEYNATGIRFVHQGSGAELIYIRNEDIDRAFTVTFKTPPETNQGIQHILEHSLLASSENYPGKDVFFDLAYKGYTSFLNAMTSPNYTQFLISSLSEKQLFAAADFMLDLLFRPSILTEPRYFYREAFRYEMESAAAPLQPVGVVFNEMKTYESNIANNAYNNAVQTLFPDTPDHYNSGGVPKDILQLTYEDAIAFYHKYYAPSKAKMFLYGKVDYRAFLEHIDKNIFAAAPLTDANPEPNGQETFSEMKVISVDQPVSAGSKVEGQSYIELAYGLPKEISRDEMTGMMLLVNEVFNHESFPLLAALRAKNIAGNYSFSYNTESLQPSLLFEASYSDPDKAQVFQDTILEVLTAVVAEGVDQILIDSIISQKMLADRFLVENPTKGIELIVQMTSSWNMLNSPFDGAHSARHLEEITARTSEGFFEDLIEKHILHNTHAVLLTSTPKPGLLEKKESETIQDLADKKAAMSKEEIQQAIQYTADFKAWDAVKTPIETIDKLTVMSVADLPEEVVEYEVKDETVNDIRILSAVAKAPDVAAVSMICNIENVDPEMLQYFNFYSKLIGRIGTEKYNLNSLAQLISKYLYSPSSSLVPMQKAYRSEEYQPSFRALWMYDPANSTEAYDLVSEMLFKSKLTEESLPMIQAILAEQNAQMEMFKQDGMQYTLYEALGVYFPSMRFINYFSGPGYIDFLQKVSAELQDNPALVLQKMDDARKAALNRDGLVVIYGGSEGSEPLMQAGIEPMISLMSTSAAAAGEPFEYPAPLKNKAIFSNANVQNIALSASTKGILPYSEANTVVSAIITDELLTPEIRLTGGAYGAQMMFRQNAIVLFSYSDPNLTSTLNTFAKVPETLINTAYTQEDLDQHIITSYSAYAKPLGELTAAIRAATNKLTGKTTQDKLNEFKELKSITLEDLPEYGKKLREVLDGDSQITVYGYPDTLNANKDLFENTTDVR